MTALGENKAAKYGATALNAVRPDATVYLTVKEVLSFLEGLL